MYVKNEINFILYICYW